MKWIGRYTIIRNWNWGWKTRYLPN